MEKEAGGLGTSHIRGGTRVIFVVVLGGRHRGTSHIRVRSGSRVSDNDIISIVLNYLAKQDSLKTI